MLLLCTSCVTITAPGSPAKPKMGGSDEVDRAKRRTHGRIVDTWELMYQINQQGDQELPRESTRVLLEFTDRGRVIMNEITKNRTDPVKSSMGKYELLDNELSITDDGGRTVRWPFKIVGDTLILSMPEKDKKFFLRRYR